MDYSSSESESSQEIGTLMTCMAIQLLSQVVLNLTVFQFF